MNKESLKVTLWLTVFTAGLVWSGIDPFDRFTWLLEVAPAIVALIVLAATYNKFRLSPLVYWLILVHSLILMVGGKYTYAKVPLFDHIRDIFGLARNHYDRVGHFAQGFVPALVAREILIRKSPLRPGKWLFFIVTCICLSISACYEFLEWWVSLATGEAAESFLGTQGDVWDTQMDMFLALVGAISAQLIFSHSQDKTIQGYQSFN